MPRMIDDCKSGVEYIDPFVLMMTLSEVTLAIMI